MERILEDVNVQSSDTSSKKNFEAFEDVLQCVGDFGKYQRNLLLALFPFTIAFATIFFSQMFMTAVPQEHWCKVNELMNLNLTQNQRIKIAIPQTKEYPFYDRCHHRKLNFGNLSFQEEKKNSFSKWETNETVKCTEWEYNFDQIPYASMSVEMNWVCDQEYLLSTAQSIFFIGSVLGNFIFGWIADQKGRVVALIFCIAVGFIGSIGTAHTYNFWTFALSRFISGFAYDNIITIPLFIVMEYVAVKKRTIVIFITFGIFESTGILIVSWVPYFIGNWRLYAYATSLPFLVCFFVALMLPESSRWYMTKGMSREILKKLRRISQVNGKKSDSWIYDEFCEIVFNDNRNIESATLFDLRKTPHLAKKTFILAIVFALSTIMTDSHIYFTRQYKLSIFISFTWISIECFLSAIFVKITLDRWGRTICGFFGLLLVMVFSYAIVVFQSEMVKLVAGFFARFSIFFVQILLCQYVPEFFPTTVRTQGAALVHFSSIMMHFIAPYMSLLANIWRELPMLLVGTLAMLNSILILLLPETFGKNLPQTLQDGENFCKTKKFW